MGAVHSGHFSGWLHSLEDHSMHQLSVPSMQPWAGDWEDERFIPRHNVSSQTPFGLTTKPPPKQPWRWRKVGNLLDLDDVMPVAVLGPELHTGVHAWRICVTSSDIILFGEWFGVAHQDIVDEGLFSTYSIERDGAWAYNVSQGTFLFSGRREVQKAGMPVLEPGGTLCFHLDLESGTLDIAVEGSVGGPCIPQLTGIIPPVCPCVAFGQTCTLVAAAWDGEEDMVPIPRHDVNSEAPLGLAAKRGVEPVLRACQTFGMLAPGLPGGERAVAIHCSELLALLHATRAHGLDDNIAASIAGFYLTAPPWYWARVSQHIELDGLKIGRLQRRSMLPGSMLPDSRGFAGYAAALGPVLHTGVHAWRFHVNSLDVILFGEWFGVASPCIVDSGVFSTYSIERDGVWAYSVAGGTRLYAGWREVQKNGMPVLKPGGTLCFYLDLESGTLDIAVEGSACGPRIPQLTGIIPPVCPCVAFGQKCTSVAAAWDCVA